MLHLIISYSFDCDIQRKQQQKLKPDG